MRVVSFAQLRCVAALHWGRDRDDEPTMPRLHIDDTPHDLPEGSGLLTALQALGIAVPHLCHDERLPPAGVCRLCMVQIEGEKRPVPACAVTVREGMRVYTRTPQLQAHRAMSLRELSRHLPAELSADPTPLGHTLRSYGLQGELGGASLTGSAVDDSHPYLHVDMSRCVNCYRCQRICAEVQGQFTWQAWGRGRDTRFVPDSGGTLRDSSCVSCGACADTCPSGAIEDKSVREHGRPTAFTRTTCAYCGVGCELLVGSRDGRVTQIKPALDAKVNKGHLCVKGRYAFEYTHAQDRVTTPMIRRGGAWEQVSWEQALSHVARELRRIGAERGPDAVGVLGSSRATNEENYLAQKLARVALGTHNVDCCARVCHAPSASALGQVFGTGASTSSFDDIERAHTIFVFGANPTECHPVVGARIKQAARRGARLIVADPRRIELADHADVHLQLRAGTNVPLLHALAHVIVAEGLVDRAFIDARVSEWDAYCAFIADFSPERVAQACSVEAAAIRQAARLYAASGPAISFHGLGATEHVQGTETVICLANLALLTGNVGKPGTGVNPLRGQNNVQGSAHMGCEPRNLTGSVKVEAGRERFERVWSTRLPTTRGLDWMEMLDAAGTGTLRALYVMGYDVLLSNPDATRTRQALGKLELVVVQDLFMTETARQFGTVFLPVASNFEKDGTFMNAERRIQRVRAALPPPPGVRTDAEVVCALAAALGHAERFAFGSAEEIWNEIRAVWPAGAGITYARIAEHGLQWPCPTEDHPGTTLLHADEFTLGKRAALRCVQPRPSPEVCTPEFPMLLTTGRRLYQFNAATMTARTKNQTLQPADVLDMCPQDAAQLGLHDGQPVTLVSRYGEANLALHVTDRVRQGELFTTFHTTSTFVNHVTSPHRDAITHAPEYKVTAVRVEAVSRGRRRI
jgi:formate dehydrogenase major subunit